MHAMLPLLKETTFPPLFRRTIDTLQVNLGYRCNQACLHCHVNAGPERKEMMGREIVDQVLDVLRATPIGTLDLTGGAPELNPHFRYLVAKATRSGARVIDRCNLTILNEPGFEDLAEFLARHRVEVTASLPCYAKDNVDQQRGDNVFASSILGLQKLNALGYGR
jgi:radical SAM/Cys-rich protein